MALPTPYSTLLIMLGASSWPNIQFLNKSGPGQSAKFLNSADEFRSYFLDARYFGIPGDNCLDLFDDGRPFSEQAKEVSSFVKARCGAAHTGVNDIIVHYLGHGHVLNATGSDELLMPVVDTSDQIESIECWTTRRMSSIILGCRRNTRVFFVLDCCFARAGLAGVPRDDEPVSTGILPPTRGMTVFWASEEEALDLRFKDRAGVLKTATSFTHHLVSALKEGERNGANMLTWADALRLTRSRYHEKDESLVPNCAQKCNTGNMGGFGFFPNPGFAGDKISRRDPASVVLVVEPLNASQNVAGHLKDFTYQPRLCMEPDRVFNQLISDKGDRMIVHWTLDNPFAPGLLRDIRDKGWSHIPVVVVVDDRIPESRVDRARREFGFVKLFLYYSDVGSNLRPLADALVRDSEEGVFLKPENRKRAFNILVISTNSTKIREVYEWIDSITSLNDEFHLNVGDADAFQDIDAMVDGLKGFDAIVFAFLSHGKAGTDVRADPSLKDLLFELGVSCGVVDQGRIVVIRDENALELPSRTRGLTMIRMNQCGPSAPAALGDFIRSRMEKLANQT